MPPQSLTSRNSDPLLLHPLIRNAVREILGTLKGEGVRFELYEGFRSPSRQATLYAQGRSRPGSIVTRATPWDSFHQYGLAADLVMVRIDEKGKERWSWDITGANLLSWERMHDLGLLYGLEPISWEMPHLQIAGVSLRDVREGRLPGGGDKTWWDNLIEVTKGWKLQPPAPEYLTCRCSNSSGDSQTDSLRASSCSSSSRSERPKC